MNRVFLTTFALGCALLSAAVQAQINGASMQSLIEAGEAESVIEQMEEQLEAASSTEAHYWLARGQLAHIDSVSVFRKIGLATDARSNLETALELDENHVPTRVALGRYYLEAPAIAGGSAEKAQAQADALLELDKAAGYRLMADIAREAEDQEAAIAYSRKALQADAWNWPAQYGLVVQGVHFQVDEAISLLDEAETQVRQHEEAPDEHLRLLDYQRGKLSAVTGQALEAGNAALTRYLAHEPAENEPSTVWAEFRLAQVERQQGLTGQAQERLSQLESQEIPEDLGFAIQDERRWHYED
ncbi:MAG: hypothetical protein AAGH19_10260 [Pseudomonadota bacterium]